MLVQKSRQLGQNYISPEHIVLALFVSADSAVKAVIEKCVLPPCIPLVSTPQRGAHGMAQDSAPCVSNINTGDR